MTTCEIILLLLFGGFLLLFFLSWKRVSDFLEGIAFVKDRVVNTVEKLGVKLWMDHMNFTREYLIAVWYDLPFLQQTTDRLMKNQDDLARFIDAAFPGKGAYEQAKRLLEEHIAIAAEIAETLKSGQDVSSLIAAWRKNASDIALIIASLSPKFNVSTLQDHLFKHLETTQAELGKIFESQDGIQEYDTAVDHMLAFNDYILQ